MAREKISISQELEASLNLAVTEATRRGHVYVTVEHILFALLSNKEASEAITSCGGSLDEVKKDLESFFARQLEAGELKEGQLPQPTIGFQRVIQRAAQSVQAAGKDVIHGSNILVAIYSEKDSFAAYYLQKQDISRLDVLQFISHGIVKDPIENNLLDTSDTPRSLPGADPGDDEREASHDGESAPKKDALGQFAVDLCARAREGKIDPLIGRDDEIERAMQVLCRRRKNNPLFVGEAGVGKTALAEGLALKIVNNDVPPALKGARIFALDMGLLVAGSKYRGDFESRLKNVIASIKKVPKGIIFIDEIHTLVGAGAVGGGALDASNLLKPALASGELRCIGSTTYKEYRNHFEGDSALVRRFQKIDIEEPSVDTTVKILQGLRKTYEDYHSVKYASGAIKAAVDLSHRYITDRRLPDKAIDVMDEAAAALTLKGVEAKKRTITVDMVQNTVARMARIPPQKITQSDREYLRNLETRMKAKVFGQDAAIDALSASIKMSRSGLGEGDKPVGSFLFAGPTGVGKTEVAKQLAAVMGVELIRFDMSEYMERHSVARLIGAPPGYVGFDQGGMLTEAIIKKPHAVLLLDEIEKAHPDMQNILLQVMDHGSLTDNNGRKADFRNVVIIMTTNAGAQELTRAAIGFRRTLSDSQEKGMSKAVRDMFSPEFRNRLSAIITFMPLPLGVVVDVVKKFIGELQSSLVSKRVTLHLSDEAYEWLAKHGYDEAYGARPVKRLIDGQVKRPLVDELLYGKLVKGGEVHISVADDKLAFKIS